MDWPTTFALLGTGLGYLLSLVLIRWVLLLKKENSASTVAWVMAIAFLPYLGGLLFLVFGINRVRRRALSKESGDERIDRLTPSLSEYRVLSDELPAGLDRTLHRLVSRTGRFGPVRGNDVEILDDTNRALGLIEQAILSARETIHLEYYIWSPDRTGTRVRDLLVRRAREGVKVRFLYDGIGSLWLSANWRRPMVEAGIEVAAFLPGAGWRERWSLNLRNHRKIVVVDGRTGFTGGMNIADEYLGRRGERGYWRDTHLRVTGPAVLQLQQVFAEDWYFATGEELIADELFPDPGTPGDVTASVVAGGPSGAVRTLPVLLFSAVNEARNSLHLATGYFVPPEPFARALEAAAWRGVRVRLLVPGATGYPWTRYAGRSYYERLLQAGVEIHEYARGSLHSKTLTVDGRWSLVGSANCDNRSFYLNFEAGLALHDPRLARRLEEQFGEDLDHAVMIDPATWNTRAGWRVLTENACRMFAPVF